ncbi:hypothetical protein LAZ67_X001784 [Cordylochernes scorpioides]|uniref:DUF5641 domain-containing protein n=1 Tax=Cordylochernes scorpioides TaxID=51811 RepID=A0ABY6LT21_9ARAC|nr:hypothetical protein LAZ67_X001784 [Cordylochernes scorpioides]
MDSYDCLRMNQTGQECPDLGASKIKTRWQLVRQLVHHLWRRWSREYINGLQQRNKWTDVAPNLWKNAVLLVKEDRLPPAKWLVGRVLEPNPGKTVLCGSSPSRLLVE